MIRASFVDFSATRPDTIPTTADIQTGESQQIPRSHPAGTEAAPLMIAPCLVVDQKVGNDRAL